LNGLDALLREAFQDFEAWLLDTAWRGKEHDCVNVFAHKFLAGLVRPEGPIFDLTQVGIEVGVPQPHNCGERPSARKDLVIWAQPGTVAWGADWKAVNVPATIIEWKAPRKKGRTPPIHPYDREWLQKYSLHYPNFVGYCATVDFSATDRRVFTLAITATGMLEDFHRA
jgi:hypothetical protein